MPLPEQPIAHPAIITALSVASAIGGTNSGNPRTSASALARARSAEFAATPPQITNRATPIRCAASSSG